ncbi:MAG: hypothetical protein JXO49_06000 [Deltaproteobacteria bacterium]|nr:hypothetical protein [Candidatus Anaeroferrophillus wilburensis]MBN2888879.1 hypothetical protein [Deltaproteobacteria bacterium]
MKKLLSLAAMLLFLATAVLSQAAIVPVTDEVVTGKITSITLHNDRYRVKINTQDGKEMKFKYGYQSLYVPQDNQLLLQQVTDCKAGRHTIATIAYQKSDGKIIKITCRGPGKGK